VTLGIKKETVLGEWVFGVIVEITKDLELLLNFGLSGNWFKYVEFFLKDI